MSKKKFIQAAVLLVSAFAFCMTVSSCDEKKEEPQPAKTLKSVKVEYDFTLNENWYRYFDITVEYTSNEGVKTFELTEAWSDSFVIPYSKENNTFVCHVIATPKSEYPEIQNETDMSTSLKWVVTGIYSDGTDDGGFVGSSTTSKPYPVSAKVLTSWMEKDSRILLNYDYNLIDE